MIVITGAAGFIGSHLLTAIATRTDEQVAVIEDLRSSADRIQTMPGGGAVAAVCDISGTDALLRRHANDITAVFHLGAISSTTCADIGLLRFINTGHTLILADWCAEHDVDFIYASSASTYGDGNLGFVDTDDLSYLERLKPLNPYAQSKQHADWTMARRKDSGAALPPHWYGLKFFNVYGPGEDHKGPMASVLSQMVAAAMRGGPMRLFRDGQQRRDWIWVGDAVDIMLHLWRTKPASGLYNVGSASAVSFREAARAVREAGLPGDVEWIEMPSTIAGKYQSYTCAHIAKLRRSGFTRPMLSVDQGIRRLVAATTDPRIARAAT
jgi:ADP-L-glycero-D-manno-heptose 6-epimerase